MRPADRNRTDKQECDQFRKKFAGVLAHVSISLNEMNSNIQDLSDPDILIETVKEGYVNAIENMCGTLDYANNIQVLSRMTKKLKADQGEPHDIGTVDIFGRIEKLSYEFVLRLRRYELEHSHDEDILSAVTLDQAAIQNAIVNQLGLYEQSHYERFGDDIPDELNFACYFKDISKRFNVEFKK